MSQDWFWEGNIVDALARALMRQGWQATSTGDADKGLTLVALQGDRELLVEVKGFPPAPPPRGPSPRAGQPRPVRMAKQARQWYADALLGVMLKRHTRPEAQIALALPAHRTYRSLVKQTARALQMLGVGVFLIDANGDAETLLEPAAAEPGGP